MRASAAPLLGGYRRQTMLFPFHFRDHVDHQDQELWFDGMAISGMRKNEVIHCRITEYQPKEKPRPRSMFSQSTCQSPECKCRGKQKERVFHRRHPGNVLLSRHATPVIYEALYTKAYKTFIVL